MNNIESKKDTYDDNYNYSTIQRLNKKISLELKKRLLQARVDAKDGRNLLSSDELIKRLGISCVGD